MHVHYVMDVLVYHAAFLVMKILAVLAVSQIVIHLVKFVEVNVLHVMMYTVGHVVGLQHLLEVAAELVMVIVKHITNCLSNIVHCKFDRLCIYYNYCS